MKRSSLVIPLVLAAATLAFPVPAGATAASDKDPTGDVKGAKDPRADITDVYVNYAGGAITVGVAVVKPEPPTTRNWIDENTETGIYWTLFHPNGQEYEASFSAGKEGPSGELDDPQEKEICKGQAKATFGADKRYVVSFPANCLGNPATLSVASGFTYQDITGGKGESEDLAPDDEKGCCKVTPS